jgi:hypothetical protein
MTKTVKIKIRKLDKVEATKAQVVSGGFQYLKA